MAFGQQIGPPASARQLKDLAALLEQAGYASFREARGPLGFSQRQGGGKFTAAEASEFIDRLEAEAEDARQASTEPEDAPAEPTPRSRPVARAVRPAATPRSSVVSQARLTALVKDVPPDILAAELERRGWMLIPPEGYEPASPPP
jgi:hypothetical protein